MGRTPCCPKVGVNRGAWCGQEDRVLTTYINANGEGSWKSLPQKAGECLYPGTTFSNCCGCAQSCAVECLNRCGKSCRLRWINYLKPGIKRGGFTLDEDDLLIKLHNLLGNRWALIAGRLPGRTDNEIKNYWNTSLSKKAAKGNAPQNQGPHCPKVEYILQQPRSTDDQLQVVHRTKAYRCKKVILPAGLKTSDMLLSEEEAEEHQWSNVMQNEEMRSLVISQDEAGDGSAGSSSSALFSFSPELVLSRDFEAMPDWAALEKMASFLDLEVDEWNSLF